MTEKTTEAEEVKAEEMITDFTNNSTLATILKTEIDVQIATAKAYPRSLTQFLKKAETIATITQEVAESCAYALPRKEYDKKTNSFKNKILQGPSVRLAEIVCSSYGNIRSAARIISNDGRVITAQGVCHDLETNNFISVEVKRRITTKEGKSFSEDMQVVTGNAACAIAFRNAVFKVIPAALINDVYEKVLEVSRGTAETLIKRRDKALKFFRDKGVKDEQLCDVLEVVDVNDIDLERLGVLSGMKASIMNNESTVEELFPIPDAKDKGKKANDQTLDMMDGFKGKKEGAK